MPEYYTEAAQAQQNWHPPDRCTRFIPPLKRHPEGPRLSRAGSVKAAHLHRRMGGDMQDYQFPQRYAGLLRALCVVIVALMLVAILFAAWIALANFNTIGV